MASTHERRAADRRDPDRRHGRSGHARHHRGRAQERPLRDGRGALPLGDEPRHPRAARRVPDAHRPARPHGRGPVRRLHQRDDGRLGSRRVPGRRDPHLGSVQVLGLDLAHERLARARCRSSTRTSWSAGRASSATRWTRAGRCPGRCRRARARSSRRAIIIPPVKIIERGVVQEDVLRVILNNVRLPEMNRADLFAIVAGCRAGERRVLDLCERFGKETYLAALQALLDRTYEAMKFLISVAIPEEPQTLRGLHRRRRARQRPVQDEADDLARGRPRLLRLDGHRPAGARADQLLPLRGHVQDVHRDLPDHGQRSPDPLQRRLLSAAARRDAGGLPAEAALPGGARLPHARARPAVRRARRRALQAGSGAEHGGRLRHLAVHALLGLGRQRASSSTRWRSSTAASRAGRSATGWTATRGGRCSRTSRPSTSRPTTRCGSTATRRSPTPAAPASTAAATASRSATSTSSRARSRSTTTAG